MIGRTPRDILGRKVDLWILFRLERLSPRHVSCSQSVAMTTNRPPRRDVTTFIASADPGPENPGSTPARGTDSLIPGKDSDHGPPQPPARAKRSSSIRSVRRGTGDASILSSYNPFSTYSLWPYSTSSQQYNSRAAFVRHEYDQYVSELKTLELKSQATPGELLALRDDARAISVAASSASLPQATAHNTAVAVSLQLDRSPLYGAAKNSGWGVVTGRLTTNLQSLDVPQPLIDQTLTDMRTLAASAGVSADEFQTFTNDFYALRNAESSLPPNTYITSRTPDCTTRIISAGSSVVGAFRRSLPRPGFNGTCGPSKTRTRPARPAAPCCIAMRTSWKGSAPRCRARPTSSWMIAYLAAFDEVVPTPQALSQLQSNLVTILGPAGTTQRITAVDRLVDDAPAFARAAGASVNRRPDDRQRRGDSGRCRWRPDAQPLQGDYPSCYSVEVGSMMGPR